MSTFVLQLQSSCSHRVRTRQAGGTTQDKVSHHQHDDAGEQPLPSSTDYSSRTELQKHPIRCDLRIIPEIPSLEHPHGDGCLMLSQQKLHPCGFGNVIAMDELPPTSNGFKYLMGVTSCSVRLPPTNDYVGHQGRDAVDIAVAASPSTFLLDFGLEPSTSFSTEIQINFDMSKILLDNTINIPAASPNKRSELTSADIDKGVIRAIAEQERRSCVLVLWALALLGAILISIYIWLSFTIVQGHHRRKKKRQRNLHVSSCAAVSIQCAHRSQCKREPPFPAHREPPFPALVCIASGGNRSVPSSITLPISNLEMCRETEPQCHSPPRLQNVAVGSEQQNAETKSRAFKEPNGKTHQQEKAMSEVTLSSRPLIQSGKPPVTPQEDTGEGAPSQVESSRSIETPNLPLSQPKRTLPSPIGHSMRFLPSPSPKPVKSMRNKENERPPPKSMSQFEKQWEQGKKSRRKNRRCGRKTFLTPISNEDAVSPEVDGEEEKKTSNFQTRLGEVARMLNAEVMLENRGARKTSTPTRRSPKLPRAHVPDSACNNKRTVKDNPALCPTNVSDDADSFLREYW